MIHSDFFVALGIPESDGFSMKQFADAAGIPVERLRHYSDSKTMPSGSDLDRICFAAGVSPIELMLKMGVVDRRIQSDYVVTFRSYLPVDGNEHVFKIGVVYPSGSGKYTYDTSKFEAVEAIPVPLIQDKIKQLNAVMPPLPADGAPYFDQQGMQQPSPTARPPVQ